MTTREIGEVIRNKPCIAISVHTRVRDVACLMEAYRTNAVMVVDDRKVLQGICTERDIVFELVSKGMDPENTAVGAIMTRRPRTTTAERPFCHALHLMYEGGFHHLPVVDRAGCPIGILSADDALGDEAFEFAQELERREEIAEIL